MCLRDYMRRDGFSFHVSVFNTLLSASLNDDWKRCQLLMTFFHEMLQCLWAGFCRQDGGRLLFFVRLRSVLLQVSHQPQRVMPLWSLLLLDAISGQSRISCHLMYRSQALQSRYPSKQGTSETFSSSIKRVGLTPSYLLTPHRPPAPPILSHTTPP